MRISINTLCVCVTIFTVFFAFLKFNVNLMQSINENGHNELQGVDDE